MAQNGITDTSSITPPWAAHSSNFLLALFQTDTSTINKFLPNGVYALSNENGLATTGLEIYGTDSTNGAPIYKAAFIYVEIMGHQSESNMPGHWIIWGKTNHKLLAQSLKTNFGFPFEYEPDILVKTIEPGHYLGSIEPNNIKIELSAITDQPIAGSVPRAGPHVVNDWLKPEVFLL